MSVIRPPAVAGLFYPDDPRVLDAEVRGLLVEAAREARAEESTDEEASRPAKAVIAPHAGYVYSGPVAARVYARLAPLRGRIRRVVLLGPAHRVGFRGIAVSRADAFATPLGPVPVDHEAVRAILALPQVVPFDEAHRLEHSLEVQLPFLQEVLGDFAVVPLVVGDATDDEVAEVIEALWDGDETLIVVSSDLSHYLDYETARRLDEETRRAIEAMRPEEIAPEQACGRTPVAGLLKAARRHGLHVRTLDLRNSGDTAGPRHQVVGYGAWVLS